MIARKVLILLRILILSLAFAPEQHFMNNNFWGIRQRSPNHDPEVKTSKRLPYLINDEITTEFVRVVLPSGGHEVLSLQDVNMSLLDLFIFL